MNDATFRERAETILANMARENSGWRRLFQRWPISAEPLRADARHLLDEAAKTPVPSATIAEGKRVLARANDATNDPEYSAQVERFLASLTKVKP